MRAIKSAPDDSSTFLIPFPIFQGVPSTLSISPCPATAPRDSLRARYGDVLERIREAESQYGREAGSVSLVAVSKRQPVSAIAAAHALGHLEFGENHLQEGLTKIATLAEKRLVWHFIGNIQGNKCREIAANFDWVHSVDRIKTAQRLAKLRPDTMAAIKVLIQVNLEAEISKSGVTPEEVEPLAMAIAHEPRLQLCGLMAIPKPSQDFDQQRRVFARLREQSNRLCERGFSAHCLSMGMTVDLEAAIAEGATHVRVGTAIFGPRSDATDR